VFPTETERAVPSWNRRAFHPWIKAAEPNAWVFIFSDLAAISRWRAACLIKRMTLTLIVIALQVVVTLVSLLRESGEDARFEGDKLTFRS
jgi:hypothetical protein